MKARITEIFKSFYGPEAEVIELAQNQEGCLGVQMAGTEIVL